MTPGLLLTIVQEEEEASGPSHLHTSEARKGTKKGERKGGERELSLGFESLSLQHTGVSA